MSLEKTWGVSEFITHEMLAKPEGWSNEGLSRFKSLLLITIKLFIISCTHCIRIARDESDGAGRLAEPLLATLARQRRRESAPNLSNV